MVCHVTGTNLYMNQYFIVANWTLGNKFSLNLNQNKTVFKQEIEFKNIIGIIAVIFTLNV